MASSFPLRLGDEMRSELEARARANGRSLNAEIAALLDRALRDQDGLGNASAEALLDELIRRYGANVQVSLPENPKKQQD